MEDEKIIALYLSRSEKAVTETAKKHGAMCRRVAYNILRSNEDSEECVNDTWLKAWESIPPAQPANLGAFLAKMTRNLSINLWRKRARERENTTAICIDELSECIPDPHGELSSDTELSDALGRFLGTLNAETRGIFMRRYWYACTIKEISKELHISENAVTMRLSRTRVKMREFFEKEGICI